MPVPYQVRLSDAQRTELVQTRDHAHQPYLRERAAVLLKIASGQSMRVAALSGGLKPHRPDTVCAWVHRYQQAGLAGLHIRARRGRKPAFSPQPAEQARVEVTALLRQSPWLAGLARSRWWLEGVRQAICWLRDRCLATVWRTLVRWKLVYRRGRRAVHSPDWEYPAKVQRLATISWYSRRRPEQLVRLYEDKLTYYRRPTVAHGYAPAGSTVPRADQGYGRNTARRIAACLDTRNGRLLGGPRAQFDRQTLLRFYQAVEQSYPQAEQIFLIQDNWPVHWHSDLLAGLHVSKLTLVALPTYAPWRESRGKGLAAVVCRGLAPASLGQRLGGRASRCPDLVGPMGRWLA